MPENRSYMRSDQVFLGNDNRTDGVDSDNETAPAEGALTPGEGLTEPRRGSAVFQDNNVDKLRRQLIAVEHLELCARKLEEAKRGRLAGIRAARDHGLSHQTIGDALGITEAAVRSLLYRYPEQATA